MDEISVTVDLVVSMFTPRKGDIFWTPNLLPFTEPLKMEYRGTKADDALISQHRACATYMEAYRQQIPLQKMIAEALT
jgi:hypothetical protein